MTQIPTDALGKPAAAPRPEAPATHMDSPEEAPGCWVWFGPALVIPSISGVNQEKEDLSLLSINCLKRTDKVNIFWKLLSWTRSTGSSSGCSLLILFKLMHPGKQQKMVQVHGALSPKQVSSSILGAAWPKSSHCGNWVSQWTEHSFPCTPPSVLPYFPCNPAFPVNKSITSVFLS